MADADWKLQWLGWSPWFVGVIVLLCIIIIWKIYRLDFQKHHWWYGLLAISLRSIAVVIIGIMLAGPIITQQQTHSIAPQLSVIIDDSASMFHHDFSMHPSYRFNEIQAIGLLSEQHRPRVSQTCAQLLQQIRQSLSNALHQEHQHIDASELDGQASQLQDMHTFFLGQEYISKRIHRVIHLLKQFSQQLAEHKNINDQQIHDIFQHLDWQLIAAIEGLQQHADAALAAGADAEQHIKQALDSWKTLQRIDRAKLFIQNTLSKQLGNEVEITYASLQEPNKRLDLQQNITAQASSNFGHCLDALNRQLIGKQQHSILLLTDGNHNGEKDPFALARSLGARDIPIHALLVGDIDQPRDAAIIDLHGPSEIYRADDIPISVRYHIANYPGQEWDLILSINGSEYARQTVVGNDLQQESTFIISGFPATRLKIEAELKPRPNVQGVQTKTKSWQEELWLELDEQLDLATFIHQEQKPAAQSVRFINSKELLHNRHDHYIRRLRSYVTAPEDGWYQFHISGDDQAYLWLSTDHRPQHKNLIAYTEKANKRQSWNEQSTQQSSFIYLRKSQVYYLEVLHRDYSHFDHLDVAWITPGKKKPLIIDDAHLVAYGDRQVAQQLTFLPELNTENNRREHLIIAHSDPLRLYIVDQYPRWESRLIATLLQHDDGIQIQQHYLGLNKLSDEDLAQLEQQDVILLGDVSASFLNNTVQERIASAVRDHGALLIVIAGRQNMPQSFALGPLADILPVQVNASQVEQQQAWTLECQDLDPLNQSSAIDWQWTNLPPLHWINTQATVKEQARAHIQAHSKSGTQVNYCSSIAVGAGRVMYFASDESWRWRQQIGKLAHRKWWRHVLQWGLQSRLHGTDPRLRVAISKRLAASANEIIVHARYQNAGHDHLAQLQLERLDAKAQHWNFSMPPPQLEQSSLKLGNVVDLEPGHYRCSVRHPDIHHLLETREFWIRPRQLEELNRLGTDFNFISRLTQTSGGTAFHFSHAKELIQTLKNRLQIRQEQHSEVFHLWRSWALFSALAFILFCEWFLRKQVGLP